MESTTPQAVQPGSEASVGFGYHCLTFRRLHDEMRSRYGPDIPEPIERSIFWRNVPAKDCDPVEAQGLLTPYLGFIEKSLKLRLEKQSIAYWYHLYRHLPFGVVGENKAPATIYHTRAMLDAAIQKYGRFQLCDRIAPSNHVSFDDVFAGEPAGTERELLKFSLSGEPQLVLTNFTAKELYDFYQIERLAYEIWWISAKLRITGKGAPARVLPDWPYVIDLSSDELKALAKSYDHRSLQRGRRDTAETLSGTVFRNKPGDISEYALCFDLNSRALRDSLGQVLLEEQGHHVEVLGPLSFLPAPINLSQFLAAHRPLEAAFEEQYGFKLEQCLTVIGALSWMAATLEESGPFKVLSIEERGYDGAYQFDQIIELVNRLLPEVAKSIGCRANVASIDVTRVLEWLTLTEEKRLFIGLCYPGPHSLLIPIQFPGWSERCKFFVDYAWMHRRLVDLFFGIRIDDNNFKGEALEQITRLDQAPLPHRPLVAYDGTSKQIDGSFARGKRLFIAECRVWSRSIGFENGQPEAVRQRSEKIGTVLRDVDRKAEWLVRNPAGKEYDITGFEEIIPVAVNPFVEFIPSLSERYWLRPEVPRVLTPDELHTELSQSNEFIEYFNTYRISHSQK